MKKLLVHPVTERQITDFTTAPSHAVMLIGPSGIGKKTLAVSLAETVLELQDDSLPDYAYKVIVKPEGGKAIGIEAVRELEHFLSLKVPRATAYNRAVIIQDSHLLTPEAQNALLKTIEEPPTATIVILTASHEQSLLPTIRSRSQAIHVKRPQQASLMDYFQAEAYDSKAVSQAQAISGGLPGLMTALLTDSDHPLLLATEKARLLLSQTAYDRLLAADELSKQRPLAIDTCFILQQMAHLKLQAAEGPAATKWQAVMASSYEASQALTQNAQPKLVLTKLMLSF